MTERQVTPETTSASLAAASERDTPLGADFVPTLLLVDDDPVACRYFAGALKPFRGYRLVIANDVARAMQILTERVIDLVLTDLVMPDVDGFGFIQRMKQTDRLRQIPVILMSSDDRTASKITGFELGICDYVTKPFQMAEVVARIDGAIKRSIAGRTGHKKSYNLTGDFSGLSFCDLVNLLAFGQRTGTLFLITPRATGSIQFFGGEVYDAAFGNLEGPESIYSLMREQQGQFEFRPRAKGEAPPRRVAQSCMALLMEGARRLDEAHAETSTAGDVARGAGAASSGTVVKKPISRRPRAAQPESARVVELQAALSDPKTRGELHLLSQEELQRWTKLAEHDGRFHVVMLAPLLEGVLGLASMANAISERHLATAFSDQDATATLHVAVGSALDTDVILLDQAAPTRTLRSLHLSPHVLLVAPGDGDWGSLGVDARIEVASLVSVLCPQTIVGIGNEALESALRSVCQQAGLEIPIRVQRGALTAANAGVQPLLAECVSAWFAAASVDSTQA